MKYYYGISASSYIGVGEIFEGKVISYDPGLEGFLLDDCEVYSVFEIVDNEIVYVDLELYKSLTKVIS